MEALKAIKIIGNQNDGRAVFLFLPNSKYRVTKGFKFHARPQTGAYSCSVSTSTTLFKIVTFAARHQKDKKE